MSSGTAGSSPRSCCGSIGSGAGGRLGAGVREGKPVQAIDGSRVLVAVMALATLLLLLDMIFKPWA